MGIEYSLVDANIYDILPNFHNDKLAFLAKDLDGKQYIFKPSWIGHFHNPNEYIAHHIGSLIGAPLLDGAFLKISAQNMQKWDKIIKSFHHGAIFPTFIPPYNNAIFFAVEFKQDSFNAKNSTELQHELNKSSNKIQYYSQFSLDQYLKNPDRHFGNHIFFKESHKLMFYLIDFDRIFTAATDWSNLSSNVLDFECFKDDGYNMELYQTVCNTHIRTVRDYAGYIEKISDEDIEDICKTTSHVYSIDKNKYDKLLYWLLQRRDRIFDSCLKNEPCYNKVTKRGYLSASR